MQLLRFGVVRRRCLCLNCRGIDLKPRSERMRAVGWESFALPVNARANFKLRSKGMVEVRYITKTTIQGDVDDPRLLGPQSHCRFTQACPHNVPVRSHSGHLLESAKEMVGAQASLSRKSWDCKLSVGIMLDHPEDSSHPRY